MTGTDVREALRAVADTTDTPMPDRLDFQRQVRRERRRRTGGRLLVGVAATAAVAVGATALGALPGDRSTPTVATPYVSGVTDLESPVHLVADGRLVAVDPRGTTHDLGPAEEVVGWTSEYVWYLDDESRLTTRAISGAEWAEPSTDTSPVQSAQLSADGRFLGWVDLRERLHVQDLKAGTTADPVQLEGSGYLVDLAQGTGLPLVSDDRGLSLLTPDGPISVPGSRNAWDSSATRELIAVVGPDDTQVYSFDGTRVRSADSVPGYGRLSPYGDMLASVEDDQAFLWPGTGEPVRLDVPGDASRVAWGDDDTVLVSTFLDRSIGVYACDAATAGEPCAELDLGEAQSVTLGR